MDSEERMEGRAKRRERKYDKHRMRVSGGSFVHIQNGIAKHAAAPPKPKKSRRRH